MRQAVGFVLGLQSHKMNTFLWKRSTEAAKGLTKSSLARVQNVHLALCEELQAGP